MSENIRTYASSLGGLLGSSIGKCLLHPIDTVKAKLQVGNPTASAPTRGSYIVEVVRETIRKDGLRGLYRGF